MVGILAAVVCVKSRNDVKNNNSIVVNNIIIGIIRIIGITIVRLLQLGINDLKIQYHNHHPPYPVEPS